MKVLAFKLEAKGVTLKRKESILEGLEEKKIMMKEIGKNDYMKDF